MQGVKAELRERDNNGVVKGKNITNTEDIEKNVKKNEDRLIRIWANYLRLENEVLICHVMESPLSVHGKIVMEPTYTSVKCQINDS